MRERILSAADRLFYERGIRAVGVDAVAAAARVSKRTLYDYYPSKDDLIVAYVSRRAAAVKDREGPPLAQILGVFDWLERWFASRHFRGCPFINAATDLAEPGHPAFAAAALHKAGRRAWFKTRLQALGATAPEDLAWELSILVDGAITTALVSGDTTAAQAARRVALKLLAAAGISAADTDHRAGFG
jgi:AcrR family transcriptional regulator